MVVLLTTVAALVVAVVGTRLTTPTYEASATIRVATSAGGALGATAANVSNQLVNTAAQIAASRPMLDELATRLNLKNDPVVRSVVIPQTELIKITVQYSDARSAALIANTLADMLIARSNQLYTGGQVSSQDLLATQLAQYKEELAQTRAAYGILAALTPPAPDRLAATRDRLQVEERSYDALLLQYNDALRQTEVRSSMMTVVEPAAVPASPAAPQAANNYLIGLVLGLFFGIVLAFLAESFDPTLHTIGQVESAATIDIGARIPKMKKEDVRMLPNAMSPLAEAYRAMATNTIGSGPHQAHRVSLITSAEPRQGKSTAAANLATALAERGMTVVAIDCDMRRPKLHELFNLPNETGLADVLGNGTDLKDALQHPADCIAVLTSGRQPANPAQLLGSPQMAKVVSELHQQFDFIVLDTPSVLALSDTLVLVQNPKVAQSIDGFVLVVRQAHARRDHVQAASALLKNFGNGCASIVLVETDDLPGYAYYQAGMSNKTRTDEDVAVARQGE